jgi:TRAP-type C4-dicarboxylate transport system substrate-binding protein
MVYAFATCTALITGSVAAQSGGKERTFNLQLATYTGPTSADSLAYNEWVKRIDVLTNGTVKIEIFRAGSLLKAAEILQGVGAGRADLGAMSFFYFPAAVPLTFIVNLPYQTENAPAQTKAFQDLYRINEAYRQQYEKRGVVNLFNWTAPTPPVMGCKKPVTSLKDLKGRSVRVGGLIAEAWEPLGVQIVALAAGEVREAVERGLIDCWAGLTMDLVPDLGLHEVTPYLYDWGWGNFGTYEMIVNQRVWNSFSDSQRKAINKASAELIDRYAAITDPAMSAVCKRIKQSSAKVLVLPKNLQVEWRNIAQDRVNAGFYRLTEKNGVPRSVAETFFKDYTAAIARHEPNFPRVENAIARCANGKL